MTHTMKRIAVKLAAGAIMTAMLSTTALADTITLRVGSGHADTWPFVKVMTEHFLPELERRVASETEHELNLVVGLAGTIVKPTEVLEGVQSGIIDIGLFCVCHEDQKLKAHNVFMYLPFGPSDPSIATAALRKVYDEVPEFGEKLTSDYGQMSLLLIPSETYDLISRVKVETPEDLRGLKVSAAGPNLFWIEPLGAQAISITGPEVYTGFETGMIDINIAFASLMDSLKLYDVAPYLVRVGLGAMASSSIHINNRSFEALPEDVQKILLEVAAEAELYGGQYMADVSDRIMKTIDDHGGATVVEMAPERRQEWAAIIQDYPAMLGAEIEKETGLPMRKAMKVYFDEAARLGHEWPVQYDLD